MKKKLFMLLGAVALSGTMTFQACTNLEEPLYDRIDATKFFKTDAEFQAALTPAYANLRKDVWAYFNLQEVSSDEIVVPTRGNDWGDNGRWVAIYLQNFTPGLSDLNDVWNDQFAGVARCNSVLAALDNAADSKEKNGYIAELRALRAYYYYHLLDLFGNVPIVGKEGVDLKNPPATKSSAEVFAFIETELKAAIADIPAANGSNYGRMTKGAVNGILAKLYLNAKTYTGAEKLAECKASCEAVLGDPAYAFSDSYFDMFGPNNDKNSEVVFSAVYVNTKDLGWPGMNLPLRTLHYSQPVNGQGPWNGFSVTSEFYSSFDAANDKRAKAFLIGQQYKDFDPTKEALQDRNKNPLIFKKDFPDIAAAVEADGIRCLKYSIDPGFNTASNSGSNDLVSLRYTDFLMMKAEVDIRQGNAAAALPTVNKVRARAGLPALTAITIDDMLVERGHEFYWEGHRRQDLIRFGKFGDPKTLKPAQGDKNKLKLMPIPGPQLDANPNLKQNPGY